MGQVQGIISRYIHGEGVNIPEDSPLAKDRKEIQRENEAELLKSKKESPKNVHSLRCYASRGK